MSKWLFAHYRSPESTLPIGVIVDNQKDLVIAEVYEIEGVNHGPLMGCAPEMLEALKFAKEVVDDQVERFHQDCRCKLCESLPMMIDAAIAKAEATNGR